MDNKARVLAVVRDANHIKRLADQAFGGMGYDLTQAKDLEEALGCMRRERFDIVIADLVKLVDVGLDRLKRAKRKSPETAILLQSDNSGVFLALGESGGLTAHDLCALEEVVRRVA